MDALVSERFDLRMRVGDMWVDDAQPNVGARDHSSHRRSHRLCAGGNGRRRLGEFPRTSRYANRFPAVSTNSVSAFSRLSCNKGRIADRE